MRATEVLHDRLPKRVVFAELVGDKGYSGSQENEEWTSWPQHWNCLVTTGLIVVKS